MFVMEPLKSMEAVLPDAATPGLELVCPAGSLPALKAAVDHGANCIAYAHGRGCKVFMALNTYPQAANPGPWRSALDKAVDLGVDAVILADPGLMQYALQHHPRLRLHLSVQGSATNYEAINFYREQFGIVRAVLPRV